MRTQVDDKFAMTYELCETVSFFEPQRKVQFPVSSNKYVWVMAKECSNCPVVFIEA